MSESWRERAACKGMDPAIFFPERGGSVNEALTICERCPVRLECRLYALQHPELVGIWGGMSGRSRTRQRPEINQEANDDQLLAGLVQMLELLATA